MRFTKEQESIGLLRDLRLKKPFSKVPLFGGDILFYRYKMNKIRNKFLLVGDKFIPELHLRRPGSTHSVCGIFTRNKERIKYLKKQEIQDITIKID